MEKVYTVENDIKLQFPKFPKHSKSVLEGKKLEIKENGITYQKIEYKNGAEYDRIKTLLTLPNGEKFEGILTEDNCGLKKGIYFWPNNQKYYGTFDEKNRFSTNDTHAELTFSNGDIFRGEFQEGKIGEGLFISEGKQIRADFTEGKINGLIEYNDEKKGIKFNGKIIDGKKEEKCEAKFKIKNKQYLNEGEYTDGQKDGTFIIRELYPNEDNLFIKGKYKEGERDGYFDIIDKEKGINISHQYISFLQIKRINEYNKKYNENINGKEVSISITCRNNPINQLNDFMSIRFMNLLTLDLTRANIDSISFLNSEENTLLSLQNLILSYNNISDIGPLVNVDYKKLKTLIVNDNKIKDINCVEKFKFNELEELNLSNNPIKSIKGIEKWKFPNLFNLSFNRTKISDITPLHKANFPNLTQLDLYLTNIKNKENVKPEKFEKCKNLKNIIFDEHLSNK